MMLNEIHWSHPIRFGVALALGLLVGLERESAEMGRERAFRAGVRTYAILSLFGFACAWLYKLNVQWVLPAGLAAVAALVIVEYLAKIRVGRLGWTSEIAALLTFAVGALSLLADIWVPLALGLVNLALLSEKSNLESFVERLDKTEFLAVIRFLLITLIVLPVLPNKSYTQFDLNPMHIWEIVILVSAIGFVGYFLSKKFGSRLGLWFSGMLGGIVSSTAVSIAVGRIAQKDPEKSGAALQASILASSFMYPRNLILIALINPAFAAPLWWKLMPLMGIGLLLAYRGHDSAAAEQGYVAPAQNPFEIRPALAFAALFVLLSVITVLITQAFGKAGLLTFSGVVGVTDITPYILSLVRGTTAVQPILVAALIIAMMSNTIIKGVYFASLVKSVRRETLIRYLVWALLHIPFIFLAY